MNETTASALGRADNFYAASYYMQDAVPNPMYVVYASGAETRVILQILVIELAISLRFFKNHQSCVLLDQYY